MISHNTSRQRVTWRHFYSTHRCYHDISRHHDEISHLVDSKESVRVIMGIGQLQYVVRVVLRSAKVLEADLRTSGSDGGRGFGYKFGTAVHVRIFWEFSWAQSFGPGLIRFLDILSRALSRNDGICIGKFWEYSGKFQRIFWPVASGLFRYGSYISAETVSGREFVLQGVASRVERVLTCGPVDTDASAGSVKGSAIVGAELWCWSVRCL